MIEYFVCGFSILLVAVIVFAYTRQREMKRELKEMRQALQESKSTSPSSTVPPPPPSALLSESEDAPLGATPPAPTASAPPPEASPSAQTVSSPVVPPPPPAVAAERGEAAVASAKDASSASMPTPPPVPSMRRTPPAPPAPPLVRERKRGFEEWVGANIFSWIGIFALVLGVGFFVKYAIDKNWINEAVRTGIGFGVGFLLLALAHWLRKNYRIFSSLLAGGALAVFFITTAIAYNDYALFSRPIALGILIATTAGLMGMSMLAKREELGVIALIGGALVPFIISVEHAEEVNLYVYMFLLFAAIVALGCYHRWWRLLFIALCVLTFSEAFIILIFAFHREGTHFWTTYFNIACWLLFLSPLWVLRDKTVPRSWRAYLLIFMSALLLPPYISFDVLVKLPDLSNLTEIGHIYMGITLVYALLYALFRKREGDTVLTCVLFANIFMVGNIAVCLYCLGSEVLAFFSAELVALFIIYLRTRKDFFGWATLAALFICLFGFAIVFVMMVNEEPTHFCSLSFAMCLVASFAVSLVAFLMHRYRRLIRFSSYFSFAECSTLLNLTSVLMIYTTIASRLLMFPRWALSGVGLFTVVFLLLLFFVFRYRYSVRLFHWLYVSYPAVAIFTFSICSSTVFLLEKDAMLARNMNWGTALIATLILLLSIREYRLRGHRKAWVPYLFGALGLFIGVDMAQYAAALTAVMSSGVAFSLSMIVGALVLMGLGVGYRQQALRQLSIVALLIVVAKLLLIDVWTMSSLWKIVVFILVGIVLLSLSFLYQRLRKFFFSEEEKK